MVRLNDDKEMVKSIKEGLKRTGGYCPCKMLSPLVDKYSEEDSSVKVGKVNVDEENELAAAFGISSIPALFVVKHGKVVASTVGYMPEEELKSFVASAKAK